MIRSGADHVAAVRRYYDLETEPFYRALWHDDHLHLGCFEGDGSFDHALERMIERVVGPAAPKPGDRALDVGCGIGGTCRWLAARGVDVLGFTVSDVQVAAAVHKGTRCVRADAAGRWPAEDGSIDLVVSLESVCHYPEPSWFWTEARRVVGPRGRVAFSDWMAGDGADPAVLAAVVEAWCLAGLDPIERAVADAAAAGWTVRAAEGVPGVRPNGALARRRWLAWRLDAAGTEPDAPSRARLRQLDVLATALLGGDLVVGRLLAEGPG